MRYRARYTVVVVRRSCVSRGPSAVPEYVPAEKNGTTAATGTILLAATVDEIRLFPSVPSDFIDTTVATGTTQPARLRDRDVYCALLVAFGLRSRAYGVDSAFYRRTR